MIACRESEFFSEIVHKTVDKWITRPPALRQAAEFKITAGFYRFSLLILAQTRILHELDRSVF